MKGKKGLILGGAVALLVVVMLFLAFPARSAGELNVEGTYPVKCSLRCVDETGVFVRQIKTGTLVIDGQTGKDLATCTLVLTGIAGTTDLAGSVSAGATRLNYLCLSGYEVEGTTLNVVLWARVQYKGTPAIGNKLDGVITGFYTGNGKVIHFHGSFTAKYQAQT